MTFTPDPFQVEAIESIRRGRSVVVTAPTGSGKTFIAEQAIEDAFGRRRRTFYTTPLKALSNQKFNDFRAAYGSENVGLLTGDNSLNGQAPVVVMTTEVTRNMIYGSPHELDDVDYIVLDEVHYLQDRLRGPVWEEIIVHAPPHVRLVCLSATISNAREFADWVSTRRGPVDLVDSTSRPVPLNNLYAIKDRWNDVVLIEPLHRKNLEGRLTGKKARRYGTPRRVETIDALQARDLLPAIYFIFSRAGCEDAAGRLLDAGRIYTTPEERSRIVAVAEAKTAHLAAQDLTALGYDRWLSELTAGIAPHHAGMVPAFKETVEELFADGLVRVVFATETLSLGINMPARTVVLESLSRFNGETHEVLRPGDYTQLTGRAGRRGIDLEGFAVVLHSRYLPLRRIRELATAGSHPLRSAFRPTYNMAVNLVAAYPQDRAERLLAASFGQYQRRNSARRLAKALARREREADRARQAAMCDRGDVFDYLEMLRVRRAAAAQQSKRSLRFVPGTVFEVPTGKRKGRYVVFKAWSGGDGLLVVDEDGALRRLKRSGLPAGVEMLGTLRLPKPFRPKDRAMLRSVAAELRDHVASTSATSAAGAAIAHPVAECPDLPRHLAQAERALRAEREAEKLRKQIRAEDEGLIREFRGILDLLATWGYVDEWTLTGRGEALRRLYNELDLVLAESLRRGVFTGRTPAELAALVSLFVYEPRRDEDGAVVFPSEPVRLGAEAVLEVWEELVEEERRRRLPPTRPPEAGFATAAYAWTEGANLDDILDTGSAGDAVRVFRQLIDVLRQLADADATLSDTVRSAVHHIDRGVVAAGGML